MSYGVPDHSKEYKQDPKHTEIGFPGGKSVKVYEDGAVEAHAFIDKNHKNLDYGCDDRGPFFQKKVNDSLKIKYFPDYKLYYEAICEKTFSIVNCFGKILSKVKKIPLLDIGRFKHSKKIIQKGIKEILKLKKKFIFTKEFTSGERVSIPYRESTTYGPYNYPVKIKTNKDVDFIKDIIVIKTGAFTSSQYDKTLEEIVYISPHVHKTTSGTYYTATGVNYKGDMNITTGQNLDAGVSKDVEISYLTSEDFAIPSGSYLSSSTTYKYYPHSFQNTVGQNYTPNNEASNSLFSYYNNGTKMQVMSGEWDGIIPSGGWFSVESWSYNGDYVGFDGDLIIEPVDTSLGVTMSATIEGRAEDHRGHTEAYQRAELVTEKKFLKKLNKELMDLGYKKENSNYRRYKDLILRSAQGYIDPVNNKLLSNYELQQSANPLKQDFDYNEDIVQNYIRENRPIETKSNTVTGSTTSSSSSSISSTSSY